MTSLPSYSSQYEQLRRGTPAVPLLDYQQLAEWLNDSVRHLRRLVDEGRIPYVKVGHFVRFDRLAIDRWLEANRRGDCDYG
jgi:excisionase family DNA binding protein